MPPNEVRPRRQTEGAASGTGAGDDRLDPILTQGAPLVAHVTRVKATRTTRLITVRCPLCGREHVHGWPYVHDAAGHRVAHCRVGGRGGYLLAAGHAGEEVGR